MNEKTKKRIAGSIFASIPIAIILIVFRAAVIANGLESTMYSILYYLCVTVVFVLVLVIIDWCFKQFE
jgi:hypothetical protein